MFDFDEQTQIQRAQAGDSDAFGCLVRKYHDRLSAHIQRRVTDADFAKDLTQQTWLKAFGGIAGFRCDSAFYSWLYRIAENVITDAFRKQKHQHGIEALHLIDPRRIRETHPCPSREIERCELRSKLRDAIAELTPIRRRVFRLYDIEKLPIKAIASRLNRSEGTIKTHLRNARLQLQELLTPYRNNTDIRGVETRLLREN